MADILWNLDTVYPALDSDEFNADKDELVERSAHLLAALENSDATGPEKWIPDALGSLDRLSDLAENLLSYVYALWSVNTADERAQAQMDDLESRSLALKNALVHFRARIAECPENDWNRFLAGESAKKYRFWLEEQRFLGERQMSPAEESLAADLQRSGGDAWDRLHGRLSSAVGSEWDGGFRTVTELRALAFHTDRSVRKKAWEAECGAWKTNEIAFAAALNGVKGTTDTLNSRRGWGSTLEKSLAQNRLSRPALDAMLGVMQRSLPLFRRYFQAKATMLGLDQLSWYDLFAPVSSGSPSGSDDASGADGGNAGVSGQSGASWTWERCRDFIPRMFDTLSTEMGDFSRRAFRDGWIDATPRKGKVGGAYCTHLPLVQESRILCNFDGSFDSVSTVAHELGHAWHGEVMKNLDGLNREYPMTLAETASIFSETLVFRAALSEAPSGERPAILDAYLMGAAQVVVDILSRFHFESALMRARPSGELSPRELTEMMLEAQDRTYGDALKTDERHGWMWAVKGHYYSPDLAFYNFPYAFGQLFALGLYSLFRQDGPAFAERYALLLKATGSDDAVGVARQAGFNIESPDFWQRGIDSIAEIVQEFEELAGRTG